MAIATRTLKDTKLESGSGAQDDFDAVAAQVDADAAAEPFEIDDESVEEE